MTDIESKPEETETKKAVLLHNMSPNRVFIELNLAEDEIVNPKINNEFVGMYLLEYGNIDNYIYKHQMNNYYIFEDIFGLVLADNKPNENFDNYNVIYIENTENKQFIPNVKYKTDKPLQKLIQKKFKMCIDSTFPSLITRKDIDLYKIVITYHKHCYIITDIIEYYTEHNIEENIDFNYELNSNLFENKKDLEDRIVTHPWIVRQISKSNKSVMDFVEKCNAYIKQSEDYLNVLIKDNIEFIKNIGRFGIFYLSDNSSDYLIQDDKFQYKNMFKNTLFGNMTNNQKLLLSEHLFLFNGKNISEYIDKCDSYRTCGFIASYIYLKVLRQSKQFGFDKQLELNDLFLKVDDKLYISFNITDTLSNNLILINDEMPKKDFSLNIIWFYFNDIENGYGTNFGVGDISTTNKYNISYNLTSSKVSLRDIFIRYLNVNNINVEGAIGPVLKYLLKQKETVNKEGVKNITDNINSVVDTFINGIKGVLNIYKNMVIKPETVDDKIEYIINVIKGVVSQPVFDTKNENTSKYFKLLKIPLSDDGYCSSLVAAYNKDESIYYYIQFLIEIGAHTGISISEINKVNNNDIVFNILDKNNPDGAYHIFKRYNDRWQLYKNDSVLSMSLLNDLETELVENNKMMNIKSELDKQLVDINKIENEENKWHTLFVLLFKQYFNYDKFVYKCRIAILLSKVIYKSDELFSIEVIKQNNNESIGSIRDTAKQILYDQIIRSKLYENFNKLGVSRVNEDSECLFKCLNNLTLNKQHTSVYMRKIIVETVFYLYNNFDNFKFLYNYFYSNLDLSDYINVMNTSSLKGGYIIEIIAFCHIYNVNVEIMYLSDDNKLEIFPIRIPKEDGSFEIKQILQPTYFDDNIFTCNTNTRVTYKLFFIGHLDNFDTPYFGYMEDKQQNKRLTKEEILLKLLHYSIPNTNCLINKNIKCGNELVCDLRIEKCNKDIKMDDHLKKFKDKEGNIYIGYPDEIEKFKAIKGADNITYI